MSLMLLEKVKAVPWSEPIKWFSVAEFMKVDADKPVCEWKPEGIASIPPPVMVPEVNPESDLLARFVAAADRVIEEAGPYHASTPRYVDAGESGLLTFRYIHQGQGDCIVGRILTKMGHEPSEVAQYEGNGADVVIHQMFSGDPQVGAVASLANTLQRVNDSSMPWASCRPALAAVSVL